MSNEKDVYTNDWLNEQQTKIRSNQTAYWNTEQKYAYAFNKLRAELDQEMLEKREKQVEKAAEKEIDIYRKVETTLLDLKVANSEEELKAQRKNINIEYTERIKNARAEKKKAEKSGNEAEINKAKKRLQNLKKQRDAEIKHQEYLYKNKEKLEKQFQEKAKRAQEKAKKEENEKAGQERADALMKGVFGKGNSIKERIGAVKDAFTGDLSGSGLKDGFATLTKALSDFAAKLEKDIDTIAANKTAIDTRLQGSNNTKRFGSYWERMSNDIVGVAGVSPLVKQSDIVTKVNELVGKGIAFNVEQRAFLASISDKIATTFNVADSTLLRLVRIQQQDSTAARLGMESTMTAFLNNMYETTEYLEGVAESVRSSLQEAEALMGTTDALELEYQIQKWIGSMYSVGMSQNAVNSLSQALGQIAAGDISGLTGEGAGNLVIMAANNAGLSIADILTDGLNASDANNLMQAMVEYLALIYDESKTSKVVQQQFAKVYGISASDLKAATNLTGDNGATLKNIAKNNLTYNTAMQQLTSMANSMYTRVSIGQMMSNAYDNLQYTMAAGIANSPILYSTYKIAGLLDSVAGGIAIPALSVYGNMVDLETTVADLMQVGALSGSILKGLGQMLFNGGGGIIPSSMLKNMGIETGKITSVSRGTGSNLKTSGVTVSQSGYVGNADGSDVKNKTLTDATDDANAQLASAKEEEENEVTNKVIDSHIVDIYNLLTNVVNGTNTLKVSFSDSLSWPSSSY